MRLPLYLTNLSLVLACARVAYRTTGENKSAFIIGRSVDYVADPYLTFWVFPAGIDRHGGTHRKALQWRSRYASTVAVMYNKITVEGMNEKGLSGSILFLGGSHFGDPDTRPTLSAGAWLQYYLDQYENVGEVEKENCPTTAWGKVSPQIIRDNPFNGMETKMHIAISDAKGGNLIIEHIKPSNQIRCYSNEDWDVAAGDTYHMQRLRNKKRIRKEIDGRALSQWPMPYERYDRLFFYNYHIRKSEDFASALATTMGMIHGIMVPNIKVSSKKRKEKDIWPTQWMMYTAPHEGFIYYESARTPLNFNYQFFKFDLHEGSDIKLLRVKDLKWNWQKGTGDVTSQFQTKRGSDFVPFMSNSFDLP